MAVWENKLKSQGILENKVDQELKLSKNYFKFVVFSA